MEFEHNTDYLENRPALNTKVIRRGMFIEITDMKVKGKLTYRGIITYVDADKIEYTSASGQCTVTLQSIIEGKFLIKTADNLAGLAIYKRVRKLDLTTHHPTMQRHLDMEIYDGENKVFDEVSINGIYYYRRYQPTPLENDM